MKQEDQYTIEACGRTTEGAISRRTVLGASAVALLGLLSGSALGGEQGREARAALPSQMRQRMEESQAYAERMRDAGAEERVQMMRERMTARHQQAIEDLKEQLGISDKEWPVIKPRIEAVYNLVRPLPQSVGGNASTRSEVQQKMQELREVLGDKGADVDRIKTKLTAVRTAKEKANQKLAAAQKGLRQLMTIRQEATLVLNGLLD